MVTGEYHKKILMALYTCIMLACKFLHTQVNHDLINNGNRNTDREREALHGWTPALGRLLSYYHSHLCSLHQFSIVNLWNNTNMFFF